MSNGLDWALLLLLAMFVFMEWLSIPLRQGGHVSFSFAIILFSFFHYGLFTTTLLIYLGVLSSQILVHRRLAINCLFNAGIFAIVIYFSGHLFYWARGNSTGSFQLLPVVLVTLAVYFLNSLIVGLYLFYINPPPGYTFPHFLRDAAIDAVTYLITIPLGLLMIYLSNYMGLYSVLYIAFPLAVISFAFRVVFTQQELNQTLVQLHEVAAQLANSQDMDQVLEAVVNAVFKIFHTEYCWLVLTDETGCISVIKRGEDIAATMTEEERNTLEGLIDMLRDSSLEGRVIPAEELALPFPAQVRDIFCSPLRFEKNLRGIMLIGLHDNNENFKYFSRQLLPILSGQAAVALKNTSYYKVLEKLAATDEKTGLYNFRYFYSRLQESLRTLPPGERVSLLMCDLDNFKAYNDRYGHLAGDQVLAPLGEIIRDSVRTHDIVARFGGDEFIVLLQGTGKQKAIEIGERIRKAVEEFPFTGSQDDNGVKITVSIGVSEFPDDAVDEHDLIRKADIALYRSSKQGGRNLVSAYTEEEG